MCLHFAKCALKKSGCVGTDFSQQYPIFIILIVLWVFINFWNTMRGVFSMTAEYYLFIP